MNTPSLVRPVSLLLLAGALWLPALSAADAPIIGDTYISGGAPATNFGSAAAITIAAGNTGLVQFNLCVDPCTQRPGGVSEGLRQQSDHRRNADLFARSERMD